jgi:L-cysteate sulfo-lyase
MDLDRFPRVALAHLPTPLEPLDTLSALLGGPRIWVKRDDCTGLSTGGNKARKLEFLLADAREQGADTVITAGATQSNHARQTAAACAKLGMRCAIVLEDRAGSDDPAFTRNGNVLLDHLHGAEVSVVPGGTDLALATEDVARRVRDRGRTPYLIPVGGSNAIGGLGYALAAAEVRAQCRALELELDQIVLATGSGGTQAGLLAGLARTGPRIPVLGFTVKLGAAEQHAVVEALTAELDALLDDGAGVDRRSITVDDGQVGPGYGVPTAAMAEALRLLARCEGLLLDPVYSGKAFAGLIAGVRDGRFSTARNVLFWHTGGSAALFGYANLL